MADWPEHAIGELFDVELGKMLSPRSATGVRWPYLANRNVQWGRLELDDLGTMHFTDTERQRYSLQDGDVLVCEGGEIGRTAIWHGELEHCYFQNAIHRLRPRFDADSRFARHFMEHAATTGKLRRLGSQTSIAHLPKERLVRWRVSFPPPGEQRRIAEILDSLDGSISATHRLIEKQSRLAVGMERLIFEQLRHSAATSLDELASVGRGRFTARPRNDPAFYGGPYPFAQTGDVAASARGLLRSASQSLNERGRRVSRSFPRGAIAVTIAANIADTAILRTETFFPDSVVGVVPHDPSTARWIEMCIHQHKPRLEAIAPQSAQKNINLEDLRPLRVPDAPVEDCRRFGALYEDCDRALTAERDRLGKLTAMRAGLADDLLTGRTRTVPV